MSCNIATSPSRWPALSLRLPPSPPATAASGQLPSVLLPLPLALPSAGQSVSLPASCMRSARNPSSVPMCLAAAAAAAAGPLPEACGPMSVKSAEPALIPAVASAVAVAGMPASCSFSCWWSVTIDRSTVADGTGLKADAAGLHMPHCKRLPASSSPPAPTAASPWRRDGGLYAHRYRF